MNEQMNEWTTKEIQKMEERLKKLKQKKILRILSIKEKEEKRLKPTLCIVKRMRLLMRMAQPFEGLKIQYNTYLIDHSP